MSAIRTKEVMLSPNDYVAGELKSEVRHEYLAGRAYAMAGASTAHNIIAGNFHIELGVHLRGKQCRVFTSDMKVHIRDDGDDWFYYPDVMVNCTPAGQKEYWCDTPAVIVEVLSRDTEKTDRREKLFAYRKLASLHTYILAAQDKREITVFHRLPDGWEECILTADAKLNVPELDFSIGLDAIYADTDL
jgi:Uma2 family endonuclease